MYECIQYLCAGIRNRRLQHEALQHLLQLLPVPNRDTLWVLLAFLSQVAQNSEDHRDTSGTVRSVRSLQFNAISDKNLTITEDCLNVELAPVHLPLIAASDRRKVSDKEAQNELLHGFNIRTHINYNVSNMISKHGGVTEFSTYKVTVCFELLRSPTFFGSLQTNMTLYSTNQVSDTRCCNKRKVNWS
ncbi:Rho GTPase-activating protein 6 [Homalodisca vitripennis]|nr:Rho GTPase-activating protein 6 [Homalodisca vitripennis]